MARKKVKGNTVGTGWMVTFADLMTLLLTFFVVLLSMSSLTMTSIMQVNNFIAPRHVISLSASGKIPQRIEILKQQIKDPETFDQKKERIKDLLFPLDTLPPEMNKSKVDKNLEVMQTGEGIVIVMTDALLFERDQYELSDVNKAFLHPLYDVFLYTNADINIAGYTDDTPARGMSNYALSGLRALAVLDYFLVEANSSGGLKPMRFSVSGYGPDRPIASNDSEQGKARNRRVEILLKNEQWFETYD